MTGRFAAWLRAHPDLAAHLAGGPVSAVSDEGGLVLLERAGLGAVPLAVRGFDVRGPEPADADDQLVPPEAPGGRRIAVVPLPGAVTWADLAAAHPEAREFARRERLILPEPLERIPDHGYAAARDGLHRLAEVVAAVRERLTSNEIALRGTAHGFASPAIAEAGGAAPAVVLDDGPPRLVLLPSDEAVAPLEGLSPAGAWRAFAEALSARGVTLDLDPGRFADEPIPPAPAGFAALTGFSRLALEHARLAARPGRDRRVNLWPEHFDQAFERGEVTCGISPGDDTDPRPYVYVLTPRREGPLPAPALWRETPWPGAYLPYDALCDLPSGEAALALAERFFAAGLESTETG